MTVKPEKKISNQNSVFSIKKLIFQILLRKRKWSFNTVFENHFKVIFKHCASFEPSIQVDISCTSQPSGIALSQ